MPKGNDFGTALLGRPKFRSGALLTGCSRRKAQERAGAADTLRYMAPDVLRFEAVRALMTSYVVRPWEGQVARRHLVEHHS